MYTGMAYYLYFVAIWTSFVVSWIIFV